MTNPNPGSVLDRFYASLSFFGLAGVTSFIGLMLVTPLMIQFSKSELELAACCFTVTTAVLFGVYTLCALFKSNDQQAMNFDRHNARKLMALLAAIGVYMCEILLWFAVSELSKPFWVGSSGGAWFIASLFLGTLCGIVAFARWYHQLVWPRPPR